MQALQKQPQAPALSLRVLPEIERQELLAQWHASARDYPTGELIHELFEAQVARTPNAVAVVYEGESLRYAVLNAGPIKLARHLRTLGVGPDAIVGVCLERSLEMVVALLAVLKAGGAYLPLDPQYPPERLQYMQHDAQVKVLLTQRVLDEQQEQIARYSEQNLEAARLRPQSGVRPLYVRIDRYPEGRDDRARQYRQLPALVERRVWQ